MSKKTCPECGGDLSSEQFRAYKFCPLDGSRLEEAPSAAADGRGRRAWTLHADDSDILRALKL